MAQQPSAIPLDKIGSCPFLVKQLSDVFDDAAHLVRSRRCYVGAVQTAEQRRALWEAQRALVAAPQFAGIWEPFGALSA